MRSQVHLWTLAQREGTPCVPVILAMRCNNENACAGLGDRIISLGSAFWLVRRERPTPCVNAGHSSRAGAKD